MTTQTTVNDNTIDIGVTAARNSDETQARRFAADLPRGDDRINQVQTSVSAYVTVWLDDDFGADGGAGFRPPEGYDIVKVFVSSRGSIAIDIEQVDA
jgi:hypothetical protein